MDPWRTVSSTTEHSENHGNNQDLENPPLNLRIGVPAEVDHQSKPHPGGLPLIQELSLVLGCDRLDGLQLDDDLRKANSVRHLPFRVLPRFPWLKDLSQSCDAPSSRAARSEVACQGTSSYWARAHAAAD